MEYKGRVREIVPYDRRRHAGGYGFIQSDDDQSIFFLLAWANYQPVKVGDYVEYETEMDEANRLHANPVQRDEKRMAKQIKLMLKQGNYTTSRKRLPVPGVRTSTTNMAAAYEYLNNIQNDFGEDNDVLPSTMLSTINEWISKLLDLMDDFDKHEQLKNLLVNRNLLPKNPQIEELITLQKNLRKMNYEQRGRYYGVRGEQLVQAKLDQHQLEYVQNPTLPEFDSDGNVIGATEIDFITVSMFGIHVIEVKNYGANKNQEQKITITKDGQWGRIGAAQENVTNQNDLHIAAVEGVLFSAKELENIDKVKLLATPIFVIPNENFELQNLSAEIIVRTGLLYDAIARPIRKTRQAILTNDEVQRILAVLNNALEANRQFQYVLPDEHFLNDAYSMLSRYEAAMYVFEHLEEIYQ